MSYNYKSLKKHPGIYKHKISGNFLAKKKIKGKSYGETFDKISDAIHWRNTFNGISCSVKKSSFNNTCSTLAHVWKRFQELHFPSLNPQTQVKMIHQYRLLKDIEHFKMNELTSTLISEWIIKMVKVFKDSQSLGIGQGVQARCSMNIELRLLRQLFNWYKEEDDFEIESYSINNPVKKKHTKLGWIKALPNKDKKISPDEALLFFNQLEPIYRDIAIIQYFCAGRIGETLGIQKKCINLKKKEVLIKYSAIYNSGKTFWYLSDLTKTGEERKVHITDSLKQALLSRLDDNQTEGEFLFNVNGVPMNYGTVLQRYNKALKKCGLDYSGTHIMRHGLASLARTLGGSLDAVMAVTGHKDYKVAGSYAELNSELQVDVSEKIDRHLKSIIVLSEDNLETGSNGI